MQINNLHIIDVQNCFFLLMYDIQSYSLKSHNVNAGGEERNRNYQDMDRT